MTNMSDPDESPDNPPKPIKPAGPKGGAFPTPKSEIEKAKPYIPDMGEREDCPEGSPDRPADVESEEKRLTPAQRLLIQARKLINFKSMREDSHMMPDQSAKRGAIPTPRNVLAATRPYSARVGAPPTFIVLPKQISVWGNGVNDDCVTAEEAFAKASNNPEILISDDEVSAWATKHGVLEGANLTQVMTWMQNDDFLGANDA